MADNSNKVEIKVNADAGNAVSALGRVSQSLSGVSRAVGAVMKTLSRLNWASMAVSTIVSWIKKLHEWSSRAATAARELQERLRGESIATSIAHATEAYKKLNKEIAEANRLEKERNQILDKRKSAARDIEDANMELAKARKISELDPEKESYAEDKAAIERKYERKAADLRYEREQEDANTEARRLYAEADRKEREANDVQKVADRQWRNEQQVLAVSREKEYAATRSGSTEDRENAKKAHEEWEKAYDAAKATENAAKALRQEAASLRRQGGEIMGSPGAKARRDAALERADTAEREAAAKKAEEDRKKSKEDSEAQAKADRAIRREKEIAALDVNSKSYDDDKAAIERKYRREELEAKRAAAAGPEIAAANADLAELENEERRAAAKRAAKAAAEEAKTDVEKRQDLASDLESVARNAASADLVSTNRLTAMGLGSGVSGGSGVASDVKRIVDLLKEEIKAVKDNKPRDTPSVAYFTE